MTVPDTEMNVIDVVDPMTRDIVALEGHDEWLFLQSAGPLDVLAYYTDESTISDGTIAQWGEVLRRRREHFASKGIAYQTLIAPDTHLVYRDKLPDEVKLAERSPFQRLAELLDDETRDQCVYPLAELVSGRDHDETYQKVDVHWNAWGAWLAYRASIEALVRAVPSIRVVDADEVTWSVQPTFGVLGASMTPERFADVPAAAVKTASSKAKQTFHLMTEQRQIYMVLEQDAPELPTAVVFRDSFMSEPAKYYAESFRRVVFVTAAEAIYYDLLDREQPDVVIHEMGERRLSTAPAEPLPSDFRALFGDLLLDDPEAEKEQRRSRTLAIAGKFQEALEANDVVLRRARPNARLMYYRAVLYHAVGQPVGALEAIRHATTIDPADAAPWHLLARVHDQAGRLADAAEAAARAAQLEPRQIEYWRLAMSAALKSSNLSLAEQLRAESAKEHPNHPVLANAASWVFAATDRLEEAEEASALAVRSASTPDEQLLAQLVSIQVRLERWEAAGTTLTALRDLAPDHPAISQLEALIGPHVDLVDQPSEG